MRCRFYFVLLTCKAHGFEAISIDRGPGTSGLRLTSGKCCGDWTEKRRWIIDPVQVAADMRRFAASVLGEARA